MNTLVHLRQMNIRQDARSHQRRIKSSSGQVHGFTGFNKCRLEIAKRRWPPHCRGRADERESIGIHPAI